MQRWAWSDCLWWILTRGPLAWTSAAAGSPVSAAGRSPSSCYLLHSVAPNVAAEADDHPLRLVPAVRVAEEGVSVGRADGLLAPDDVPAERLVAVEELLVDAADEVPRRVVVHVHLLDDHALLALDLVLFEPRVAQHVDEDVEGGVAELGRALDVVAGVLLAGEGVELAADPVDLGADVARGRPPLRPLEEHVLGEVRDPVRFARLVARARRQHDHAGDRGRLRHRGEQDAQPVSQRLSLEGAHAGTEVSFSRHSAGTGTGSRRL